MTKIVPFFENAQDNLHCLQSCVKSTLSFYFPDKIFTDDEIDKQTLQVGGWSWLPPAALWLHELGLNVEIFSAALDYKRLANEGETYMKEIKGEERFLFETNQGTYKNILAVQDASRKMISAGLWRNEVLSKDELADVLTDESSLAIGKTVHELLSGVSLEDIVTSHYIVVIKEYSPGRWKIHDPGLPGLSNRRVEQKVDGQDILFEVLLIRGLK